MATYQIDLDDMYPKKMTLKEELDALLEETRSIIAYRLPAIEEAIFNEPEKATVIRWHGGDRTVVRCGEGETFDRYTGFMAAICKKMLGGTTTAKKFMNSVDKKYQAALKAEEAAKEKAKRMAEEEERKKKAEKRRAKWDDELLEMMVQHHLMDEEAKKRAEEILSKKKEG